MQKYATVTSTRVQNWKWDFLTCAAPPAARWLVTACVSAGFGTSPSGCLALVWVGFSVPCGSPVGWPVVMFLGDVGHSSPFCGGVIAEGKLAALHLQTEPYHFTVITYLQQPPPLPPVAVLDRSSYCVFETFPDVDKLVLAQLSILAIFLYWWWCFHWKRRMWYYEILFRDLNAFSPVWMSF